MQSWATEFADMLTDMPDDSLAAALILLIATSILAILAAMARAAIRSVNEVMRARKERRRIMVDLVIFMHFTRVNWSLIVRAEQLDRLKAEIDKSDTPFRPYVEVSDDAPIFEELRKIRHSFTVAEMALLDAFVSYSKLFIRYYAKLASDAFAELPKERQKATLDNLAKIYGQVADHEAQLRDAEMEIGRLYCEIRPDRTLPLPATAKTQPKGGSDDGGKRSNGHDQISSGSE